MATRSEADILSDINSRRDSVTDLGAELKQRIDELGDLVLDTVDRQQAFSEVFAAFRPSRFDLYPLPDDCAIARTDHAIRVSGVIVDTANGQVVGQLARTIGLDEGLATLALGSNPLAAQVLKVPHHGSKHGVNLELTE
jgi:hypothetical protein